MAKVTLDIAKVGLKVRSIYNGPNSEYASLLGNTGTIATLNVSRSNNYNNYCSVLIDWDDGNHRCREWGGDISEYFEEWDGKIRKPRKVIPDIPLDPSLPILHAGHLQDRMRKKF
jgi:hypothetical protein